MKPVIRQLGGAIVALATIFFLLLGCDIATNIGPERDLGAERQLSAAARQGTLEAGRFRLSFELYDAWAQGGCYELELANDGPPVSGWTVTTEFDKQIAKWVHTSGARIRSYPDALVFEPTDGQEPLETGDSTSVFYCAEPHVHPISLKVDVGHVHESTSREQTGGRAGTWSSDEGPPDLLAANRLERDAFTLYSQWYGGWGGGTCVELFLKNRGSSIRDWSLRLQLDNPIARLLDYAGGYFLFSESPDSLLIEPLDSDTFRGGSSQIIWFCAEPRLNPVAMRVNGIEVEDGWESGGVWRPPFPGETESVPPGVRLRSGELDLYWTARPPGSGGTCIDLALRNRGAPIYNWEVEIALDRRIGTWQGGSGDLALFPVTTSLFAFPYYDLALETGRLVAFSYCVEPAALPRSFHLTAGELGSSSETESSGLFGTIDDSDEQGFLLQYRDGGADGEEGKCLAITLLNDGPSAVLVDYVALTLSGAVDQVYAIDPYFGRWHDQSNTVRITFPRYNPDSPEHDALRPGQTVSFRVCMSERRTPVAFRVVAAQ